VIRWRQHAAVAVLLAVALTHFTGCVNLQRRVAGDGAFSVVAEATETIYVVRRGWHVEVAFAAAEVSNPPLSAVVAEFPGVRYLSVGFGDRHYLVARNKNAPSLLRALWPGAGLILATGLSAAPQRAFGAANVIEIRLTSAQMRAAQGFVGDTLALHDGEPKVDAAGPYEGSLFLTSTRRYSAANTCNTWVARTLQAAGLPVHAAGVAFAGQIWSQARRIAEGQNRVLTSRAPAS
jgi:Protein of unknown function (DUF2459)